MKRKETLRTKNEITKRMQKRLGKQWREVIPSQYRYFCNGMCTAPDDFECESKYHGHDGTMSCGKLVVTQIPTGKEDK